MGKVVLESLTVETDAKKLLRQLAFSIYVVFTAVYNFVSVYFAPKGNYI